MKREITLGQLLSVAVTIIVAGIAGWVSLNNKVSTTDANLKNLEIRFVDQQIEDRKKFDKMDDKLDQISGTVNDIKILLERKQDRNAGN